jgi:hypothetical protein
VITEAYDPKGGLPSPKGKTFIGIWDTGASITVINSKIIDELGLKPSGKTIVSAVGSGGKVNQYETPTYSINIILPNRVQMVGVVAAMGEIGGGDALIGMDIITAGDFSVSNFQGKTVTSFRTPSSGEIDFVEEINRMNSLSQPKIGRNDLCSCGSGKKYKKCHGA